MVNDFKMEKDFDEEIVEGTVYRKGNNYTLRFNHYVKLGLPETVLKKLGIDPKELESFVDETYQFADNMADSPSFAGPGHSACDRNSKIREYAAYKLVKFVNERCSEQFNETKFVKENCLEGLNTMFVYQKNGVSITNAWPFNREIRKGLLEDAGCTDIFPFGNEFIGIAPENQN